jgi:hypothetical protein
MAYTLIAIILGAFLWAARDLPNDTGIAILASGVIVGVVLLSDAIIIRITLA